jgi:hypothetical protein
MTTINKDTRFTVQNGSLYGVVTCQGETEMVRNGKVVGRRIVDGEMRGATRQFDVQKIKIVETDPKAQLRAFLELSRQRRNKSK